MKWLWLTLCLGCYVDPEHRTIQSESDRCLLEYGLNHLHTYMTTEGIGTENDFQDIQKRVELYVYPEKEVQAICRQADVGCNIVDRIFIPLLDPVTTCQLVVHELGHSLAYRTHGTYDPAHTQLADFYTQFVPEACRAYNC